MKRENYEWLARMLLDRSGLVLGDNKDYLVKARLPPLLEGIDADDLDELVDQLKRTENQKLMTAVVEAMTTNETSFFRDGKPFQLLYNSVIPQLMDARKDERTLRIWSAACATGQEPYSILMGLYERLPQLKSWNVELLATDLSQQALGRAREGSYNHFEVQRGLPAAYLIKYFSRQGERFQLGSDLTSRVTFRIHNLKSSSYGLQKFDVVFCRNVLIYFDAPTKRTVLERLAQVLAPDGYLFLGAAEMALGITNRIEKVAASEANVYRVGESVLST